MKEKKFRLTLDVTFDPQGETVLDLKHRLTQVVRDAVNNGTLTGDSPATVEHYDFSVKEIKPGETCKKCGTDLNRYGYCKDGTCPHSDYLQHEKYVEA